MVTVFFTYVIITELTVRNLNLCCFGQGMTRRVVNVQHMVYSETQVKPAVTLKVVHEISRLQVKFGLYW